MDQNGNPNRPSLWIFLIIVLAVLFAVVMGTSFVMHMIQARQRRVLQRRIANGEIDLETLGIKRLNVPQEAIEKMPQFTFNSVAENQSSTTIPQPNTATTAARDFYQPVCSICLDDFVIDETQVRELPCKHIYHPECIDPFLRENSSLCPLCKRSALPAGYCPIVVTNVMVRRERLSRQNGRNRPARYPAYQPAGEPSAWTRRLDRIRGPSAVQPPPGSRLTFGVTPTHGAAEEVDVTESVHPETDTEMGPLPSREALALDELQPPPEVALRGTTARRAWRRERIASLHAREYTQQEEEARLEDQRRPLWRRALGLA